MSDLEPTVMDDGGGLDTVGSDDVGLAEADGGGGHTTLSSIIGGGEGDIAPAENRRVKSGTIVIAMVTAIAGVGLYSMRTMSNVKADSLVGSEVETTIESFLKSVKPGTSKAGAAAAKPADGESLETKDRILTSLHDDYTELQVPLVNLQRDPFVIYDVNPGGGAGGDVDEPTPVYPTINPIVQQRADRRRMIIDASDRLRLKSVILGSAPLANVSGRIVRLGDTIDIDGSDVTFIVTKIDRYKITLEARDAALNLIVEVEVFLKDQ